MPTTKSFIRTPSRRQTMGPVPSHQKMTSSRRLSIGGNNSNSNANAAQESSSSSIPPPSTAKARPPRANHRASMLPRVASLGGGGRENAVPSTPINHAKKQQQQPLSKAKAVNSHRRSSMGVVPSTPKTSRKPSPSSSCRRNSFGFGGGVDQMQQHQRRQSLLPTGSSTAVTIKNDPRPIHEKSFQKDCISKVYNFLGDNGYPHPITLKSLLQPSAKDFHQIVTFLLRMVDPNFQSFARAGKLAPSTAMRLEDEICLSFKCLAYPYTLSKTALVSAGSPNSWPGLLAALTWLVEHLQLLQQIEPIDYLRTDAPFESVEALHDRTDKAFYQYLHAMYQAWMCNDQELDAQLSDDFILRFEVDNKIVLAEVDRVTDLNASIVERMDALREEIQGIDKLSQKREEIATALEQLQDVIHQMEEQKKMVEQKVRERTATLSEVNGKFERTKKNIEDLKYKIETQEMSVNDVLRIESESKGISEALDRLDVADGKRRQELSSAEQELLHWSNECEIAIGQYNSKLSEACAVIPADVSASSELADLKASLNLHGLLSQDESDVLGISVNQQALPTIARVQDELIEKMSNVEKRYEDSLDQLARSNETLKEALVQQAIVTDKTAKCEDTLQQESEAHQAKMAVREREVQALEDKVATLRDPVALEEQTLAYERQLAELEVLRVQHDEENVAKKRAAKLEIESGCQLMMEHEEHVQRKMAELNQYWLKKQAAMGQVKVPENILGLETELTL